MGAARSQTALTSPLDAHVAQAEAARLAALRWEAERRVDELRRSLALQLGQPTQARCMDRSIRCQEPTAARIRPTMPKRWLRRP